MPPDESFGPTEGGIAARHAAPLNEPFRVAPATADEFNRIRAALIPVACWRVDDLRFDFDSSFARPELAVEMEQLARLVKAHPGAPASVFGHADPVGNDEYNKALSGRRAAIIYGVMIANTTPGLATKMWLHVASQENWGRSQRSTMLDFTGLPDGTPAATLFQTYLQKVAGPDLTLTPTDFLGRGTDVGGKADFQGCSEFNPVLIVSQNDQDGFEKDDDKTARNVANASNRRVLALLFRPKTLFDPHRWPCPRAGEDTAGCRKRFWSDGENRRSTRLPGEARTFAQSRDTFACRFYQRLTTGSPCESPKRVLQFRYCLQLTGDLPWSSEAKIRFISEDGSQVTTFLVGEGALAGDTRAFLFRNIVEGVRYRGEVREGDIVLDLFPLTELFRIEDPGDPSNLVPLLIPNQFGGEPDFDSGGISIPDADRFVILDGAPPARA